MAINFMLTDRNRRVSNPAMDNAKEQPEQSQDSPRKETMLFAQLVELLTQNAVMMLGGVMDRSGRQRPPDLNAAEMMIDLLGVLRDKTKGNLTPEENRMLSNTLYQLQTAFAEIASKSGDFEKARRATDSAHETEREEEQSQKVAARQKPVPTPAGNPAPAAASGPSRPTPAPAPSTPMADPGESKVKYTKKYG
ncbi:MAG: DUF1844 domain-containing protein [Verrucomicrobiae bacterium]|nr:DUF1844 domain-containing protein [Verrucomicrobiae bacterium]